MKILFVNPCLRRNAAYKILPVGLGYVMTAVKRAGYDFDLLDIDIDEISDEDVERFIGENSYDVILYGAIVTHYKWIKWFTRMIRSYHPDTRIIVGNSVAGSCWKVFLENCPADVAVIGEGEYTCVELLDCIRDGRSFEDVAGIAWRRADGVIIENKKRKACDINELPMIDWSFFELDKYFAKSQGQMAFGDIDDPDAVCMPVSTARGCINRCTFCHHAFWRDPYRFRSAGNILMEVERNMKEYGASYINFWDDLSFASIQQAERLVDAILESGLEFNWSAAIRTDLLGDPAKPLKRRIELAKKMKKAGCRAVGFSLESADPVILEAMRKRVKPEYFVEQIRILQDVGIVCNVSIVIGYPQETKESIAATFTMCLENGVYPSIGYLLPLPSTGMYEYAKEHGFIVDEDAYLTSITERQDICINMTSMSDEEILGEVRRWAEIGNKLLELGLENDSLVKTGGYKRHTRVDKQLKRRLANLLKLEREANSLCLNQSVPLA